MVDDKGSLRVNPSLDSGRMLFVWDIDPWNHDRFDEIDRGL